MKVLPVVVAVVALVGVSACSGGSAGSVSSSSPSGALPVTSTTAPSEGDGGNPPSKPPSTPSTPSTPRSAPGPDAEDRAAGLLDRKVPWSAGGSLQVVKGSSKALGPGHVYRVRVEVESGLRLDRQKFAAFVLDTLNDRRSWTEKGRRAFARTDGAADIRVVLASPEKSAEICRPLQTFGKLSCRHGDQAVLTMYRWVRGIPGYHGDLDGYRHYVVNHEVGHALGHAHEYCAGKGKRAPLMMQQTKGLLGCTPNPWPYPDR
jgi:uncharacterized protein DUF3152